MSWLILSICLKCSGKEEGGYLEENINEICPEIRMLGVTREETLSKEEEGELDVLWVQEAIKDVGYYLRSHKFNEFDRRYGII